MATFYKKKNTTNPIRKRRCLNCGKDISNKKANAKFCCRACWEAYNYNGSDYLQSLNDRRLGID